MLRFTNNHSEKWHGNRIHLLYMFLGSFFDKYLRTLELGHTKLLSVSLLTDVKTTEYLAGEEVNQTGRLAIPLAEDILSGTLREVYSRILTSICQGLSVMLRQHDYSTNELQATTLSVAAGSFYYWQDEIHYNSLDASMYSKSGYLFTLDKTIYQIITVKRSTIYRQFASIPTFFNNELEKPITDPLEIPIVRVRGWIDNQFVITFGGKQVALSDTSGTSLI